MYIDEIERLKKIENFFELLFGKARGGVVPIWGSIFKHGPRGTEWVSTSEIDKFAEKALHHDAVFQGVCTSKEGVSKTRWIQDNKHAFREITALWAKISRGRLRINEDLKVEALENIRFQPSIITETPGGYFLFWLLKEPYALDKGQAKVEAVLKAWQKRRLRTEEPCWDLATKCPVPYTHIGRKKFARIKKMEKIYYSFDELAQTVPWQNALTQHFDTSIMGKGFEVEEYKGINEVLNSNFIEHCKVNIRRLPSNLWYALVTNLAPFEGSRKWVYKFSRGLYWRFNHRKLTDNYLRYALEQAPGPHTVKYIQEQGFEPKDCIEAGVKSPAGLAFVSDNAKKKR